MLKKLLCAILGHNLVAKKYRGHRVVEKDHPGIMANVFGRQETIYLIDYAQRPFCIRCGKPNPNFIAKPAGDHPCHEGNQSPSS